MCVSNLLEKPYKLIMESKRLMSFKVHFIEKLKKKALLGGCLSVRLGSYSLASEFIYRVFLKTILTL